VATVSSKDVVDDLIAGNGVYPGDPEDNPVVRIVRYTDQADRQVYGVVYASDAQLGLLHQYETTGNARDPDVIFEREP
jgi:hypothetical protein